MGDSRLVYSTSTGQHCPTCNRPQRQCQCKKGKGAHRSQTAPDGVIRIRREVKGRKGKAVTALYGFDPGAVDLKQIAGKLKRACGTGGSVKDGIILIQGDHRAALQSALIKAGFKVKLAGG